MAHQCIDEEHREVHGDQPDDGLERIENEHGDEADDEQRLHGDDEPVRDDRTAREHDDEGQEIERERKHPEQRHRRDVGGDVRGHRHQQARGHGRQRHPERGVAPGRRRIRRVRGSPLRALVRRAPQQCAARDEERDQEAEAERPEVGLVLQPDERLDHARIGHERKEASDIAGAIEEIRVVRSGVVGAREPGLQQRAVGGERKERQPDRGREQAHQPERLPGLRRPGPAGGDRQRQRKDGADRHHDMDDDRRPSGRIAREPVGIGISGQQRALEEHDRHRPHRRRAAQTRQHHLREHRLHHEQQRGADEDRRRERCEQQQATAGGRRLRRVVRRQVGYAHGLVSRLRSSHHCAASSFANVAIERHYLVVQF